MSVVESLPARPLGTSEVERLDEQGAGAAAYSGMPELDMIFAVMFLTDNWVYALGFDEDRDGWVVIEKVSIEGPTVYEPEAQERIDTAINSWVEKKYGERYGNEVMSV
jgi:hypothetical protein